MTSTSSQPTTWLRRHPVTVFYVLAWGISWLLWAPLWLPRFGVEGLPVVPFHHALGALGPITAALCVAALQAGSAGPADILRRMVLWRGRLAWVAVAVAGPFAVLVVAVLVGWLFAGEPLSFAGIGVSGEFPQFSAVGLFLYNVFSFGFGEEVGWRGFALPRLQARHSALAATLLLTLGWATWHLPLFLYRPGYVGMGPVGAAGWIVSLATGAVLLTWLYNQSRGSILVVALFHATIDILFTSDIASTFVANTAGALITILGIAVLVVTGPRYLSTKGKVIVTRDDEGVVATVIASGEPADAR
jgi:CAAX protease family protein